MVYRHCAAENFEDFAAGRVIMHKSGYSNFPVRLAQEIFLRCMEYNGSNGPVTVYDPCCGGGYLLTALGFLNPQRIGALYGSDIDEEAVALARDNLSLLTDKGMAHRVLRLRTMYEAEGKASHTEALLSAERLAARLNGRDVFSHVFCASALQSVHFEHQKIEADIVITDVPYGDLVSWKNGTEDPLDDLIANLLHIVKPGAVIAICHDKLQKITDISCQRIEKHAVGKRKFEIYTNVSRP